MLTKKDALILLVAILFMGWIGYERQSFFLTINYRIQYLENNWELWKIHGWLSFLEDLSLPVLLKLKWVFTLLFALVFWACTLITLKFFRPLKSNYILTHIIFGSVLVLSFFSMAMGYLFPAIAESSYFFARWLMGGAQSVILPMIILLLAMLQKPS